MKKPNLLIDVDGTLAGYKDGWQGPSNMPESPIPGAKEAMDILKQHFNIVLFSVRATHPEGKAAIEKYMADNGIYYDSISTEKIEGLIIDDNCEKFDGSWPNTIRKIALFKNWLDPNA